MIPEIKLAITLCYLAGGQIYDLADLFGFDRMSALRAKKQTIQAILQSGIRRPEFHAKNETWLKEKAQLFQGARVTNPLADKCDGCLDGLAIEIVQPPQSFGPKEYRNRKQFFAIVCQGLCDAQRRFLLFNCASPGSTHNSLAFSQTRLWEHISEGLVDHYYIAADNAYPLVGSILKPFPRKNRKEAWEESFNENLSSLQVTIENAFGVLIQRWGIFWRALRYDPPEATRVIMCCVRLHNFCIDVDGVEATKRLLERSKEHLYFFFKQDQLHSPDASQVRAGSQEVLKGYGKGLRESYVQKLKEMGIVRTY
jgi:DDE superfamily endonuclease